MKCLLLLRRVVGVALFFVCVIQCAHAADPATKHDPVAALESERVTNAGFPAQDSHVSFFDRHSGYILLGTLITVVVLFVGWTFYRRRHETEARALSGKYISDGVESAWLKFPELLTMGADVRASKALAALAAIEEPENEEFYRWAERNIAVMHKVLANLGTAPGSLSSQQVLADIAGTIESFKSKTAKAGLRPAWQLAFVLDLLVNRLRERPTEVTLSTTWTIASGLDVLAAVCRPGIPPNLIVDPPISVLAVDDDPLCLRAITFAIQKSGITPDTAVDGAIAVNKCSEKTYDVVFMDIMMPGIDGLEACQRLRSLPQNANTPVVFVTARADYQTRARSVEVGGAEFIAKPFLVTEITVKAVTFSMRKRLNLPMTYSSPVPASLVSSVSPALAA